MAPRSNKALIQGFFSCWLNTTARKRSRVSLDPANIQPSRSHAAGEAS
jgi:hypothetical protein